MGFPGPLYAKSPGPPEIACPPLLYSTYPFDTKAMLGNKKTNIIVIFLTILVFLFFYFQSTVARLSTLRLTTSHKYLYKKLDEFGKDHTKSITDAVLQQGEYMAQKKEEERKKQAEMDPGYTVHTDTLPAQQQQCQAVEEQSTPTSSVANQMLIGPDNGRKITFDNLDYRQEVHYMTEEHQNIDKHYITSMSTENRVNGNQLSDKRPITGVLGMENGKCLPSVYDHEKQRDNYITLLGRVISSNIPCLNFLSDVSTAHIPHEYRYIIV